MNLISRPLLGKANSSHDDSLETYVGVPEICWALQERDAKGSEFGEGIVAATLNSGGNSGGLRTEPGEHLVASPITSAYAKSASDDNDGLNGHLVTHTLRSEGADAGEDGTGRGTPLVVAFTERSRAEGHSRSIAGGFGVRRLTPRECERLQGFPDDWTRYNAHGKEISDSARYRMLGNAVCVTVAEWIGARINSL